MSSYYIHVPSQKDFLNFECLVNSTKIDFDKNGICENRMNKNKFLINDTNLKNYIYKYTKLKMAMFL